MYVSFFSFDLHFLVCSIRLNDVDAILTYIGVWKQPHTIDVGMNEVTLTKHVIHNNIIIVS